MDAVSNVLSSPDLNARKAKIRWVWTDVDGVLTDGGIYFGSDGEAMKRFSARDGMGVERLRNAGVQTAIITGENSAIVSARARKLQLTEIHLGIKTKRQHLEQCLERLGASWDEIAYIGDDLNDLEAIRKVGEHGLTASPADGFGAVRGAVHFVSQHPGGRGAFRDFSEWILEGTSLTA